MIKRGDIHAGTPVEPNRPDDGKAPRQKAAGAGRRPANAPDAADDCPQKRLSEAAARRLGAGPDSTR